MRFLILLLSSFFILTTAAPLFAMKTLILLQACEGQNQRNFGFCMGYIGGLYEGVLLKEEYDNTIRYAQGLERKEKSWCVPIDKSFEIIANEFIVFLSEHPNFVTNDIDAQVSVNAFFSDVFNCKN
jgi:hypothetical protein